MRQRCAAALALTALLAGCFGPGAGRGPRAATGYQTAAPIIAALEQYRYDTGHYPARQQELAPRYLTGLEAFRGNSHGKVVEVRYRREEDGTYTLNFGYVSGFPSGMNACEYHSKTRRWECQGYY